MTNLPAISSVQKRSVSVSSSSLHVYNKPLRQISRKRSPVGGIAIVATIATAFLAKGANAFLLHENPSQLSNIESNLIVRGGAFDVDDIQEEYGEMDKNTPPLEFAHGTTTLSFIFEGGDGGIVAAVDSRASIGQFVGSKTVQKVLPINNHMLGTMAGK